jgi:hypothetical protein
MLYISLLFSRTRLLKLYPLVSMDQLFLKSVLVNPNAKVSMQIITRYLQGVYASMRIICDGSHNKNISKDTLAQLPCNANQLDLVLEKARLESEFSFLQFHHSRPNRSEDISFERNLGMTSSQ